MGLRFRKRFANKRNTDIDRGTFRQVLPCEFGLPLNLIFVVCVFDFDTFDFLLEPLF